MLPVYNYLNFKMSNQKAKNFVQHMHKINRDITPYVIILRAYIPFVNIPHHFSRETFFHYNISFIDPLLRGFSKILTSLMIFPSSQAVAHLLSLLHGDVKTSNLGKKTPCNSLVLMSESYTYVLCPVGRNTTLVLSLDLGRHWNIISTYKRNAEMCYRGNEADTLSQIERAKKCLGNKVA